MERPIEKQGWMLINDESVRLNFAISVRLSGCEFLLRK